MSTIVENLNKLQSTKAAIKNALINCGENPSDTFSEYPSLIHNGDMTFSRMFECKTAEEAAAMPSAITISSLFDATNLVDMSYMFYMTKNAYSSCTIDTVTFPSNFNTNKVKNFCSGFYRIPNLAVLDLSMFTGDRVKNTKWMFGELYNVETIDMSKFTAPNCTNAQSMFIECYKLKEIKGIENMFANNSNLTTTAFMFEDCQSLESLDLSSWDFTNVTTLYAMFFGCRNLTKLKLPKNFCSNKTTTIGFAFDSVGLTELDVSEWDTSNVTTAIACFRNFQGILTGLNNFDLKNCVSLQQVLEVNPPRNYIGQIEKWDTSKVTVMYGTFRYGFHLGGDADYDLFDLSKWDTSKVINLDQFIRQYPNESANHVKKVDISSFDLSSCNSIKNFCDYCQSIIIFGEGFGKWKKEESSGSMTLDLSHTGVLDSSGNFTTQEETLNSLLNLYDRVTDNLNIGGGSALPTMTIKLSSTTSVSDEWKERMTNKGYTITVG